MERACPEGHFASAAMGSYGRGYPVFACAGLLTLDRLGLCPTSPWLVSGSNVFSYLSGEAAVNCPCFT